MNNQDTRSRWEINHSACSCAVKQRFSARTEPVREPGYFARRDFGERYGGVETMRTVVDRLQGPAPEPPGCMALVGRLRLGTGPAWWGVVVPDVAQSLPGISGPEGDQFQTPDVTGESASVYILNDQVVALIYTPPGQTFICTTLLHIHTLGFPG